MPRRPFPNPSSPRSRLVVALGCVLALLAAAPAHGASVLDAMFASGSVKLAYRDGAPPFSFRERNGKVRGYSVDLCERAVALVAEARHAPPPRIEWVPVTAATRLDVVATGAVAAECGTTTITLSRRERVDFTLPIYVDGGAVLVHADGKLARMTDLKGKRIAVIGKTTTETALAKALAIIDAPATLVPVADGAEGVAALAAGRVDGYAGDRIVLTTLRARSGHAAELAFLPTDFSYEPYGIVVPRGDEDWRLALDRALATLYRSGEIDPIFRRWFGDLGRPGPLLNAMFYLNTLPE